MKFNDVFDDIAKVASKVRLSKVKLPVSILSVSSNRKLTLKSIQQEDGYVNLITGTPAISLDVLYSELISVTDTMSDADLKDFDIKINDNNIKFSRVDSTGAIFKF